MSNETAINRDRSRAVWAGISYILVTAAPISTIAVIGFLGGIVAGGEPVEGYLTRIAANPNAITWGGLLDVIYALGVVGIIVNLYPIIKRHNASSALGFFALRFIEAMTVVAGAVLVFTLLPIAREYTSVTADDQWILNSVGRLAMHARDWCFLIGSGIVWTSSAFLLNVVLLRSRLVPRWIAVWGLIGAVLSMIGYVPEFFGTKITEWIFLPIAVQEMVFAVWLIAKGVAPSTSDSQ